MGNCPSDDGKEPPVVAHIMEELPMEGLVVIAGIPCSATDTSGWHLI